VKPRKFYATRSTFISLTIPRTRNLKALADYCGTSVAMIEDHYGRYMGDAPDWIEDVHPARRSAAGAPKPVTSMPPSLVGAEKPLSSKASPSIASLNRTLTGISLNQVVAWVREMDGLRRALAA